MSERIKETIRLSVEVEIEYTEGHRAEAVNYAAKQCVMDASSYPSKGVVIRVKTTGMSKEIKVGSCE